MMTIDISPSRPRDSQVDGECLLVFPPQWSPFQPPLSLPSLQAWLREHTNFSCRCLDANIFFYRWLLSDSFMATAAASIKIDSVDTQEVEHIYELLAKHGEICRDFLSIFDKPKRSGDDQQCAVSAPSLSDYYQKLSSLSAYLEFLSAHVLGFKISLHQFAPPGWSLDREYIERFLSHPPPVLTAFMDHWLAQHGAALQAAKIVGLSCIGQDQLLFSLLFAQRIRRQVPLVVIGGTILSRIYSRGALPRVWFGELFDCIVMHEGEIPLQRLCEQLAETATVDLSAIPGIVYRSGDELLRTPSAPPLKADQTPTPDFSDLPLDDYFSPEITLPILASRGCYWGKCEFCHHGMVYGDAYSASAVDVTLKKVEELALTYKVRNFAFNDEALPPKIMRAMGTRFPAHAASGWIFTGLFKFEQYFTLGDFANLFNIGMRSLYVGLESAAPRLLSRMKKFTPISAIEKNLHDATAAGLWIHCFLFFGFPGETPAEAQETITFIEKNKDVISSFGAGTFSLEHGAPIAAHPGAFGIALRGPKSGLLDVYYDYEPVANTSPAPTPQEYVDQLRIKARNIPEYYAGYWIPRELLLVLLRSYTTSDVRQFGVAVAASDYLPQNVPVSEMYKIVMQNTHYGIVVSMLSFSVHRVQGATMRLLNLLEHSLIPFSAFKSKLGFLLPHDVQTIGHASLPS